VTRCFKAQSDIVPERIIKELEAALRAPRDDWPLPALRALWEPLRDLRGERGRTSAHEARWLNLAGFCLRPGFGYALDDWRIKELWRGGEGGVGEQGTDARRPGGGGFWGRVSGGGSR